MSDIKVFISYSHDSDEHRERVRGLNASLSRDGCDCRLDVYKDTDEDWPAWMARQLIEADFVLCVVTETYECRFRDKELPDQGLGVGWEAGLIRRLLYSKKLHNSRIFPVFLHKQDRKYIPLELQGYAGFQLDGPGGYEALLRKVLNRPLHAKPATGTAPNLTASEPVPLFARPGEFPSSTGTNKADIDRIVKYAPAELIGREAETALLDDAWAKIQSHATPLRRFDIALSFPGEHRTFVEQVAGHLAAAFSQDRVLYDKYHDAEFARLDLDFYLPNLYRTESELLVIFLCAEYTAKRWCKLEWRYIRQLITTLEAERIMFFSFGNHGDLSQIGILSGDGYIEIGSQSAAEIAEKIRKRLALNQGVTINSTPPTRPAQPPQSQQPSPASGALAIWQRKLAFLQIEEAKVSDVEQRFLIQLRIEEAQAKIKELGG